MKKIVLLAMIVFMTGFAQGIDFTLNLGISHSLESGRFFDPFSAIFTGEEATLNRDYHNRIGVGFDLSLQVAISSRLLLIPGIGIAYGHQEVVEIPTQAENTNESETRTAYFRILSGYLDAAYRLFSKKNNWNMDLLVGMGRNRIDSEEMLLIVEGGESFWNLRMGVAASFRELHHWGARFQVMAHQPLKSDYPRYISLQGGVIYRF